jgi:predicted O-methyltransferase YrrM
VSKPTREDYAAIFERECANVYPVLDALEIELGHAIERERLEDVARTMACPLKVNPPNWQHGRVIYALIRKLIAAGVAGNFLDIGTAKGFSAVVAAWAIEDAGAEGRRLHSVDVMNPNSRERRNSVLELDGFKTIEEYTGRYLPTSVDVRFYGGGSLPLLDTLLLERESLAFAFVDGKHSTDAVRREVEVIRKLQSPGAVVMFDDVQIPAVAAAIVGLSGYRASCIQACATRVYAIATRT